MCRKRFTKFGLVLAAQLSLPILGVVLLPPVLVVAQEPATFPRRPDSPTADFWQELPMGGHSLKSEQSRGAQQAAEQPGLRSPAIDQADADQEKDKSSPSAHDCLEERLAELERQWEEQQQELEETLKKAESRPTFRWGGRIHLDYWAFPESSPGVGYFENPDPTSPNFGVDPEDRLMFRRVRLEAEGDAPADMFWRLQIEFSDPNAPSVRDIFLGFRGLPFDQRLTVGNQKRPLSLDALQSSNNTVFMERPFVVEADDNNYRRLGVLLQGHSADQSFLYQYGVFCLTDIAASGASIGDAYQLSGNARLAASPWYERNGRDYLHLAVAGMLARPDGDAAATDSQVNQARFQSRPEARTSSMWLDTGRIAGAEWFEILAFESMMNVGSLQFVGEYFHIWLQRDVAAPLPADLQLHGWYVYANYILTGESIPYDRRTATMGRLIPRHNLGMIDRCSGGTGSGWGAWGVAVRYSTADLTDSNVMGGVGSAWTAAVNWYWTPHARLQFNAIAGEIDEHAPVGGYTSGHYTILGTRASIDF